MKRLIYIYLAIPAVLASCTAPIDIETRNSEPVIVIYGCLTDYPSNQRISISASSPYFDIEPNTPVSDAVVTIYSSEDKTFTLRESPYESGVYLTTEIMSAEPGISYTLSVETDFNGDGVAEIYTAETVMPQYAELDSVRVNDINIMGFRHFALNIFMQDEPQSADYYLARFIVNDTLETRHITDYIIFSDEGINGQYLNDITLWYFDDKDNDNPYAESMNIDTTFYVRSGDRIALLFSRIERGYYDFVNQCQREKNGENPFFGGPASNIDTNIRGGGVGYFSAYGTIRRDVVVP